MNTFAFRFRQSRSCRWRFVSRKVCGVAHAVKSRWFDSENRVAGYALTNSLGRGVTATLAYDGSRMSGMTFVLPNGGTFSTALTRNAARPDLVTRRAYSANGSSIYSYDTTFDLLGRPVNATDSQSLVRSYLYNRRNELAAATIGTNAYEYAYDTIGNRTVASANSVTNTYAANNLNQYTQVDASQLTYDADGNLTQDDRFAYTYDAENRLVTVRPILPTEGALAVVNAYDHDNRRILKRLERFVDDAWTLVETHSFVYDGNNIVLERIADVDGSENVVEYFWGNDLSNTEEGAGGVGGLLAVSIDGLFYFPCYDQNGNAVAYVSESGDITAQYVYNPYGSVIEQYGNLADALGFRFSTRYTDCEIGLVSYKRRFYRPDHGRWLNRDPIEEDGGENLYGFCANNTIFFYDKNGNAYFAVRGLGKVLPPMKWSSLFVCPFMKMAADLAADALNVELVHEQLFYEDGSNVGWGDDVDGLGVGRKLTGESEKGYVRRDGGYNDCVMHKAEKEVKVDHYQLTWLGTQTKCNCQDYADMLRAKYRELINDPQVRCECGIVK